jgi:hypothetical protein
MLTIIPRGTVSKAWVLGFNTETFPAVSRVTYIEYTVEYTYFNPFLHPTQKDLLIQTF